MSALSALSRTNDALNFLSFQSTNVLHSNFNASGQQKTSSFSSSSASSSFESFLQTSMEVIEKNESERQASSNDPNTQTVYDENGVAHKLRVATADNPYTQEELALITQDLKNRSSNISDSGLAVESTLTPEEELDMKINYSIRSFDALSGIGVLYGSEHFDLPSQYPEKAERMYEIGAERTKEIYEKYGLDKMTKEELYYFDQTAEAKEIAKELFEGFKDNPEMMELMQFFNVQAIDKYNLV